MNKISAVYQIVNTITGDFYVGSSKNIQHRWADHKCPSKWKEHPNSSLYQDMQKYGIENFMFQILAPVMPEHLKQVEQEFIEMLKPVYNDRNSKGLNIERLKETNRKYFRKYFQSEKGKKAQRKSVRKYFQSEKGKEAVRKAQKNYWSQLCFYNGEILTLSALTRRFYKAKIKHPIIEAKKYLKK